jgi:polygalacturonase
MGHGVAPSFGFVEGKTTESQKLGSRARLLKYAEDDVPVDERKFGMSHGLRPQLVNFNECDGVLVKDVQLINSPFWVTTPCCLKHYRGWRLCSERRSQWRWLRPEACQNVLIQNSTFDTGDDCIAIKSGRNNDGRLWNQPQRISSSATVR